MKALITGASSGLGWDMAHILSKKGYDIIAVARRENRLLKLKGELKTNVEIVCCDLTDYEQCVKLGKRADEVDVFINNAGFGVFGELSSTDLDDELRMIETNIKAVHILTKLAAKSFKKKNSGYILNVASMAAFFPGPLFAAYYATKAYVLRLSQALAEELRQEKSNVSISVLCPGPVETEFSEIAKVNFGLGNEKGKNLIILSSKTVSEYAIKKMFSKKQVIVPGIFMKIAAFLRRIFPDKVMARAVCLIQRAKCVTNEKEIK